MEELTANIICFPWIIATVVPNSISKRIGFSVEYFADDDTWQDIGRMAVIAGTEEVIDVGSIHG